MGSSREEPLTTTLGKDQLFKDLRGAPRPPAFTPTSIYPGFGASTGVSDASCSLCFWTLVFTSGIRPPSSGSSGKRSLQRRCLCLGFVPVHPVSNHFCSAGGGANPNRLQATDVVTLDETPPHHSATQKTKQPLAFTIDFFIACVCHA